MTPFQKERLACAYYFAVPGLMYGIFTSRLPALKSMVGADDSQVGFLLLAFGGASFAGLLSSAFLLARFSARRIMTLGAIIFAAALSFAALAINYWQLASLCMLAGLFGGFCEVAMNTQGIEIEKRYKALCMSSLHACFSLGGALGSISGSAFAAANVAPFYNFIIVAVVYLVFCPFSFRILQESRPARARQPKTGRKARLPFFIYICGFLSMLCYVSEGSVGEWGSILLHSTKGAPQSVAALAFAFFCAAMVIFRFLGDSLRYRFGDSPLMLFGGLLGGGAMTAILLSPSPIFCLFFYSLMGIGFAPIVPILFSRAGNIPGIPAARASSAMSVMSYTGLLAFPPFLGILGDHIGLGNALWIIAGACFIIAFGSIVLRKKRSSEY